MREMDEAVMRVAAGPEKRSHRITEKDRRMTAYHEAGHAVVSYFLPDGDSVHEISIVPRGMAGGYTAYLPEETNYMSSARLKGAHCQHAGRVLRGKAGVWRRHHGPE